MLFWIFGHHGVVLVSNLVQFLLKFQKSTRILFCKINTEVEQEIAGMMNIRSIPTLMIMREQVVLYSEAGALPAAGLEEIIEKAKSLDMAEVHKQIAEEQAKQQA